MHIGVSYNWEIKNKDEIVLTICVRIEIYDFCILIDYIQIIVSILIELMIKLKKKLKIL